MLPLGFGAFLLFGVVLVLVGANQDAIATDLGLNLAQSGFLAAVLSLGIGAGNVLGGPMIDRFARRPLFAAATLLTAFALLTVEQDMTFARVCVHLLGVGVGGGLYDNLLNVVTVERFERQAARALAFLHAAATLGAVVAPPLLLWLTARSGWTFSFRMVGAAYLVLTGWVLAVPLGAPRHATRDATDGLPHPRLVSVGLVALGVGAFAYVGVEAGLTIFAIPYVTDGLGLEPDRGRTAISAFWFGLLLGRLALMAYRGTSDGRLICAAGIASGIVLAFGVATESTAIEIIVALTGVAIGGVFPLLVMLAARAVPHAAGTATGLVAGVGAAGGFVVPWLTGAVGDHWGVRIAIATFAGWLFLLAAAAAVAHAATPHSSRAFPAAPAAN